MVSPLCGLPPGIREPPAARDSETGPPLRPLAARRLTPRDIFASGKLLPASADVYSPYVR